MSSTPLAACCCWEFLYFFPFLFSFIGIVQLRVVGSSIALQAASARSCCCCCCCCGRNQLRMRRMRRMRAAGEGARHQKRRIRCIRWAICDLEMEKRGEDYVRECLLLVLLHKKEKGKKERRKEEIIRWWKDERNGIKKQRNQLCSSIVECAIKIRKGSKELCATNLNFNSIANGDAIFEFLFNFIQTKILNYYYINILTRITTDDTHINPYQLPMQSMTSI